MKNNAEKTNYFFVDEAGDPVFFNKFGKNIVGLEKGSTRFLLLGFIKTSNPKDLRRKILKLHREVISDPYLQDFPSMKKTKIAFHAKDDRPEIREKVFKLLVELEFKAEFFVARKIESVFRKRHRNKEHLFYDDLIAKLFENKLHIAEKNYIYFSVRGDKTRQEPLEDAIQAAINRFERKWNTKVESNFEVLPQAPSDEPCLQIIDYMNWAVQRAFDKGEMRYYKFVEDKVSYLVDIYDFNKYPNNFYNKRNRFDKNKISPL